ncbi:hypothetical protein AAMO2058_001721900 [Amorphochlora amoebiformis]
MLSKRGNLIKTFKARFFRLKKSGTFSYFKDSSQTSNPIGSIELDNAAVSDEKETEFKVTVGNRKYVLKAKDKGEKGVWIRRIEKCIHVIRAAKIQQLAKGPKTEGWLEKRGQIHTSFRRRYFRLITSKKPSTSLFLSYSKTKTSNPVGYIELRKVMKGREGSVVKKLNNLKFSVVDMDKKRIFVMRAKSEEDTISWVNSIEFHITE